MVLRPNNHGLAVQLLKVRLDEIRRHMLLVNPSAIVWGQNTTSATYDFVLYLNVMAYQTMINRSAAAIHAKPLKVDGIAGDAVFWCLAVTESSLGIHY